MNTVVLIHKPFEIDLALKAYPPNLETKYCTLTPHAIEACEKRGISFRSLEDYDNDGKAELLKEKIHADVLRTIEIGDKVIKSYCSLKKLDTYISPFRASINRLAVLLGGTQIRLQYLKCMLTATKAKKVVWFGYPARVLTEYDGNDAFSSDGSIEIALLMYGLWSNLEMEDNSSLCLDKLQNTGDEKKQNIYLFIKGKIKSVLPSRILFWFKIVNLCRWSSIKLLFPYRKNVLVESSADLIIELIPYLLKNRCGIRYVRDYYSFMAKWVDSNNKKLKDELYKEYNQKKIFQFDGIDFIDFIFPHIAYLGTLAVPLANIAARTKKYIKDCNISCVITLGAHRAHIFAILEGAKMAGAKIITRQHGAYGAYGDRYMHYDDVDICNYHICPGNGDLLLHANYNMLYGEKCYPLGFINSNYNILNPNIAKSINNHERLKSKIVYVTSLYYQNVGNFTLFNTVWKDSNLYRNQKIIIEGLNKLKKENKNLDIIIKFHPRQNKHNIPHKDYLNTHNGLSFAFQTPTFNELLIKGNIIVIDTPTTTLIQSSVTKKPLFILNSHLKLLSDAKDRLVKRAVVKDDPIELMQSLQEFIINGVYPADLNNNEFSSYYSDPFGDGNLYNRISEFIAQTCE